LDLLLLFGIASLVGLLGGRLFKLLRVPRVVGYISAGLLLGNSVFDVIPLGLVSDLSPFTDFALALIGFLIGGELKRSVFARFGRQMILLMLAEGLAAFVVVTALWIGASTSILARSGNIRRVR
jgi:Kef-type K+ transport system membrane component KefB